jgi:hypothetical protein
VRLFRRGAAGGDYRRLWPQSALQIFSRDSPASLIALSLQVVFFFALALYCVGWSFEVVKLDKGKVDGQWLQNRQPVPAVVVDLYKRAVTTDN